MSQISLHSSYTFQSQGPSEILADSVPLLRRVPTTSRVGKKTVDEAKAK